MKKQFSIAHIFLWIFVVALGIEVGAGLYETFVVMPVWVSSPPESVIAFARLNADPRLTLNAGGRFWIFMTPFVGLMSLLTLLTSFRTRPEHRKWRIAGTVLALIVVISTFAWFVPNIIRLHSEAVLTMSGEEVKSLAGWWANLNWVRAVVYSAGWLASLKAFSIPSQVENEFGATN